jgi:hypothetical protein
VSGFYLKVNQVLGNTAKAHTVTMKAQDQIPDSGVHRDRATKAHALGLPFC